MTISIISGGALTGGVNNGGSVTLTFPVDVQQDDVVYVCSGIDGTVSPSTSGYTEITTITSGGHRVGVWRKIMGATPDDSVTISGTGQPQDAHTAVALILRGVEVTQPEDATSTTASGSSTDPNNPAITTNTNTALVLAFASSRVNDTAITAPSGYNNQTNIAVSDTNPSTTAVATKEISPAGVEDPASWTDWASGTWGAITVAVRPAGYISVPVVGSSGTGQVGTVQVNENEQVSVSGVEGASDVGNVATAVFQRAEVTGVSSTGQVDNVSITGTASINTIVGLTSSVVLGNITPSAGGNFDVLSVSSVGAVGNVVIRTGLSVEVTGVFCSVDPTQVFVWIKINDAQSSNWLHIPT